MFDAELVALSSGDGRAVQDFGAVCRAVLQADAAAARELQVVAFDLLELAGDNLRSLPWVRRTELLRQAFPASERLRLIQTQPVSRASHEQLVALGFEGSVLKRPGSAIAPAAKPLGASTRPATERSPRFVTSGSAMTGTPTRSLIFTAAG